MSQNVQNLPINTLFRALPEPSSWPKSGSARLRRLISSLLEVDEWLEAQKRMGSSGDPTLESTKQAAQDLVRECLPRAVQSLVSEAEKSFTAIMGQDSGGDAADRCAERIRETNRETSERLREASSMRERANAILDWGKAQRENIRKCIDEAFGGGQEP